MSKSKTMPHKQSVISKEPAGAFKEPAPSRKTKRGDLPKASGKAVARSQRNPYDKFVSGFAPGSKRTGAGTSCPHNPRER